MLRDAGNRPPPHCWCWCCCCSCCCCRWGLLLPAGAAVAAAAVRIGLRLLPGPQGADSHRFLLRQTEPRLLRGPSVLRSQSPSVYAPTVTPDSTDADNSSSASDCFSASLYGLHWQTIKLATRLSVCAFKPHFRCLVRYSIGASYRERQGRICCCWWRCPSRRVAPRGAARAAPARFPKAGDSKEIKRCD